MPITIPPTHLKDLMTTYYRTCIVVTADKAQIIELETAQQSNDEVAADKWKAQQREQIASSNVGIIAK